MKSKETVVCVLSRDSAYAEKIQAMAESIGACPCVPVSTTSSLQQLGKRQSIKMVLLDRSLEPAEIEVLADLADQYEFAAFGAATAINGSPSTIDALVRYQLRHPVARKDLERLFDRVNEKVGSGTLKPPSRSSHLYRGLVGESAAVIRLRELIQQIAPSMSTVLVTGETGTGKEIVARNIHYRSGQGAGPFVPVNCSAIPPELLESELFGHKKGAFTGALSDREGRFAMAAGGTLFLDEIGDMTPALQVKLLRVLEERIIHRVGCNKPIRMTGRLVAATHRNLEECVDKGTFREDLFYRLNVVPVKVPPLRERKEDIPRLATELSCRIKREQGVSIELTSAALDRLQNHDWPGNVRELANLVERLAVISSSGIADVENLPDRYRNGVEIDTDRLLTGKNVLSHNLMPHVLPKDGIDLRDFLKATEAGLIQQALALTGGTMSQAATLLHVGRTTLVEKVKRLGLADSVKTN